MIRMLARFRRQGWWKVFVVPGIIAALLGASVGLFNPRLTRYVESDAFRAELEKQTAKGLHFPAGRYASIRRTGFLSAPQILGGDFASILEIEMCHMA
jgi:hypothetical protein